jgi:hypothetical protein
MDFTWTSLLEFICNLVDHLGEFLFLSSQILKYKIILVVTTRPTLDLTSAMDYRLYWEGSSLLVTQGTPRLLCNRKFHYVDDKRSSLKPTLSQMNPVHVITRDFLKIHLNIILPPTPFTTSGLFHSNFLFCVHFWLLPCALHISPIWSSWSVHPNNMWWREKNSISDLSQFWIW